jgi:hypothetical protein
MRRNGEGTVQDEQLHVSKKGKRDAAVKIYGRNIEIYEILSAKNVVFLSDRLCGLVIRVPGYRSRGQGSIPGATRFSEK